MRRWGFLSILYGASAVALALLGSTVMERSPFALREPWLLLEPGLVRESFSVLLGLSVGAAVVMITRLSVRRFAFAARLHTDLRVLSHGMTPLEVVSLALTSSFGEELLFRGLLQPELGVLGQAVLFGLLHQMGGRSRWTWMSWATLMGLVLGAMAQLTGSLVGPLVAHALVNGLNLMFLRDHDAEPKPQRLGGLLSNSRTPTPRTG